MKVLCILSMLLMTIGIGKAAWAADYDEASYIEETLTGKVICIGEESGYKVFLRATISAGRLVSAIRLTIIDPEGKKMSSLFRVSSSEIRPGEMIRFSGRSSMGAGTVEATFDPATGEYIGLFDAHSSKVNATVPITCTLKK